MNIAGFNITTNIDKGRAKLEIIIGKEGLCSVDDTSAAPPSAHTTEDLLCEVAAAEPRRPGAGAQVEVKVYYSSEV